LRDLGYVEGRDFVLAERYAESKPDQLPEIVAELVRLNAALFLSPGVQATRALVHTTSTIPMRLYFVIPERRPILVRSRHPQTVPFP
jgi:putative ABC transport system substrate-binding protein